ncbi:hypothetical protein E1B28_007360 [Marasmius oreades]|uniref:cystathionine beta-synthase n=1 Tax=Marasmius oreades TaxID=181124 RepID=A0A9P7UUU9_9AGAR|nr:uncharacterized protein E1B28_007360 [Marasmius oreades]KAG7093706.1 hypothetical protein E1B28_007360 [Marasmius oreades]
MPRILNDALEAIGNTPLIRLDRIARHYDLKCNLLGKVEYMSSGGSIKDRIARSMVEAAEREGKLIPGKSVVIEPTSGNTGVGLAMACAIKGYSVIITLPNKMSLEKEAALRALGAEVVRTPTEAPSNAPESHIGVALRLQREIPYGIVLDQYNNPNNPLAHELTTGPEIIEAVTSTPSTSERPSSGKVDVLISAAGTGGTVTGLSRVIKRTHNKSCIVVCIDPEGSVMAVPESLNVKNKGKLFAVEGIGYDFLPGVLSRDPTDIDAWIKTDDEDAFDAVQVIMQKEGLLVGGSSGTALSGAMKWLTGTTEGKAISQKQDANVVIVFPDGLRNYIGKDWFLNTSMKKEPTALAGVIARVLQDDGTASKL